MFLNETEGCIVRRGVHVDDNADELAVCGLTMSVLEVNGWPRSGMLILRPCELGDPTPAVLGREL
jgi:hypothetical protein